MDPAYEQAVQELATLQGDLEKAIAKANAPDCLKAQSKLQAALDRHRAKVSESPTLEQKIQDADGFLIQVQPDVERIVTAAERTDLLLKAQPIQLKLSAALDKSDGETALKLWKDLQLKMQPLLEDAEGPRRFADHPDVNPLLGVYREYAQGVEARATTMIHQKAATEILKRSAKVVVDMKGHLTKEDGEAALKQWKALQDVAKPLLAADSQANYVVFPEVEEFLTQYRVMEETVDAECDRLIRLRAARAIIKKGQATIADLQKAEAKADGPTLKKHHVALEALSKPLTNDPEGKYREFEEVTAYLAELAGYADSHAKGDALILQKEMEDALSKSERAYKDTQTALSEHDGDTARKKWTALQEAARPLVQDPDQKFAGFPQVQAFVAMYEELGKTIQAESASLIHLRLAQGVIAKCLKLMQDVDAYEKKGDGDGVLKGWKKVEDAALPIIGDDDTYGGFSEVVAFREKLVGERPRVAEVGERLQRLKQAQTVLRPLKTQLDAIQKGLATATGQETSKVWTLTYWTTPTDGQAISKLWAALKEKAAPVLHEDFAAKYGEFEEVQMFLSQYHQLSGRVEGEAEALIRDKEGRRLHAIAVKHLDETRAALAKSQGEAARKAWDKLNEAMRPIVGDNGRFDTVPPVQQLKQDYQELKELGADERIRVMVNRNFAQAVVAKAIPLIEKVDKALVEGKSADARKHFKMLENTVWVLIQDVGKKYGEFSEVTQVKAEWERLRIRVEGPAARPSLATHRGPPVVQTTPSVPPTTSVTPPTPKAGVALPPQDSTGASSSSGPHDPLFTNDSDDETHPNPPAAALKKPASDQIPPQGITGGAVDKSKPSSPDEPQERKTPAVSALMQQLLQTPEATPDDAAPVTASEPSAQAVAAAAAKKTALFDSDDEHADAAPSALPAAAPQSRSQKKKVFDSDEEDDGPETSGTNVTPPGP